MRFLLDTCVFLWIAEGSTRLSHTCKSVFLDRANEIYLSSVSAWEIATKYAIRRLGLAEPPDQFVPKYREMHGINALALDENAALQLIRLPTLHRDPFDRMLICQAIAEGMVILTPDANIRQYPVRTIW
jgi:PIN domain nuclease of toxin-antitoxin system